MASKQSIQINIDNCVNSLWQFKEMLKWVPKWNTTSSTVCARVELLANSFRTKQSKSQTLTTNCTFYVILRYKVWNSARWRRTIKYMPKTKGSNKFVFHILSGCICCLPLFSSSTISFGRMCNDRECRTCTTSNVYKSNIFFPQNNWQMAKVVTFSPLYAIASSYFRITCTSCNLNAVCIIIHIIYYTYTIVKCGVGDFFVFVLMWCLFLNSEVYQLKETWLWFFPSSHKPECNSSTQIDVFVLELSLWKRPYCTVYNQGKTSISPFFFQLRLRRIGILKSLQIKKKQYKKTQNRKRKRDIK